jgi:formylglycine-generating enzyme required for sulfatase activity
MSYDPVTEAWESLTVLPTVFAPWGRAYHEMFTAGGYLYVRDGLYECTSVPGTYGFGLDMIKLNSGVWGTYANNLNNEPGTRYNGRVINGLTADDIFVYGGGDLFGALGAFNATYGNPDDPVICEEGYPCSGQWISAFCNIGLNEEGCRRMGAYSIFLDGGNIRVLGGDPAFGIAPAGLSYEIAANIWSNWDIPAGTPDFQTDYVTDNNQAQMTDDGSRLYYLARNGNVAIYNKSTSTWVVDTAQTPTGFCNGAPPSWVNGELIAYSGLCNGTISTVGGRYQPPSTSWDPTTAVAVTTVNLSGGTFTVGEVTRLVTFPDAFELDITEVTAASYSACVTASACTAPGTGNACTWNVSGLESHPINCVSNSQAADYCSWVGKRLPTQQEWEYAARYSDPTTHKYPWGNSTADYNTKCNFSVTTDGYVATAPVGSYPAGNSALGLQDMAGNVWEWTSSPACFNETGPCTNCPVGGCANACDVCGSFDRVFKGGGFTHALANARSAFRYYNDPSYSTDILGFRCAKTTTVIPQ